MNALLAAVVLLGCFAAAPAWAQPALDYPDLPARAAVARVLDDEPTVLAARANVRGEMANQRRLEAGPYEFGVRLGTQQRSVRDSSERFNEWDVALERPLRWRNKARIDGELGERGVEVARNAYADARHEAARRLMRAWFAWLRERVQAREWANQVAVLGEQSDVVQRRVRAGDAPKLEAQFAEASLAQARGTQTQAATRERIALAELRQRFPRLPEPSEVSLSAPFPLAEPLEYWREQTLEHNHELALARAEGRRARTAVARASAERLPDPTVGVRYANERSNAERIVGLSVIIPLPGPARQAALEATSAQADAAAQREAAALRKLQTEIETNFATADGAYRTWVTLAQAAEQLRAGAESVGRGYALGGVSLQEVLIARRQAQEARLAALNAQVDAQEARYRLLLDAHRLWPIDDPSMHE